MICSRIDVISNCYMQRFTENYFLSLPPGTTRKMHDRDVSMGHVMLYSESCSFGQTTMHLH
jgi:hypothetical protein